MPQRPGDKCDSGELSMSGTLIRPLFGADPATSSSLEFYCFVLNCTLHEVTTMCPNESDLSTVATMVCPSSPVVSTIIWRLPWPSIIFHALKSQAKVIRRPEIVG